MSMSWFEEPTLETELRALLDDSVLEWRNTTVGGIRR
jgi:hypothetical protein